jgi:hybrid polyketide synthase/nonribosomal peptide synthetase ACE1
LEEYVHPTTTLDDRDDKSSAVTPFIFSALTETSLVALLEQYSQVLKTRAVNASDLAWTLHSRRSQLSTRIAFSASTIQELIVRIDNRLAAVKQNAGTAIGIRSSFKPAAPHILGVFTGQGAQWPAMGARLIHSSDFVRQRIQHLEDSLATLPAADRPKWSLKEEMLAGDETSRITEPALSQPLCTAIQVVLVDLLHKAGIGFSSVVGHSSGEIAAAYAAGFLSAHDAIRIAYYRGLYAGLAGNKSNHQKGAMLAAGLSWEEAQELVTSQTFKDRLAVAAHNSGASVTLSGDADAIGQAEEVLHKQMKFARRLKVNVAYHSHHMLPCGDPYVEALRACNIRVHDNRSSTCTWFSSVTPGTNSMEPVQQLRDVYWRDNMTTAVLFADAVKNAILSDEQISLVLEIGPHPALKGPATQNIADVRPTPLPYFGTLSRGNDDVESFSDALGSLWMHLGAKAVDLQSFDKAVTRDSRMRELVVELPSYQWDHGRIHWSESRRSRRVRGRKQAPHELLGVLSPESNGHDMRWSNVLKVSEIGWMEGHQLQNLVVFPAAGYVAMAIEACRSLAGNNTVELFELQNFSIPRAITFEEKDVSGVETLITLTAIEHHPDHTITAGFSVYSAPSVSTGQDHDMELAANGTVSILLGNPDPAALPYSTVVEDYNLSEVDPDRVYAMFSELGYGYTGPFRTMARTKRRLNQASVLVDSYAYSNKESTKYLVHPTVLDVAIQTSLLAYSSPGDKRLWSLHVPTSISRVLVNPEVCASLPNTAIQIPVRSSLADGDVFSANINLFSEGGECIMIQMEDLKIKPFAPATAADDRRLFSHTELGFASPDGASITAGIFPSAEEAEIASHCERVCYYYLRKWKAEISEEEWDKGQPHHAALRNFMDHVLENIAMGTQLFIDKEWSQDTPDQIKALIARYALCHYCVTYEAR